MSGWPEYVSYEKQQMYCTALFGFPIDKKFRSSWSLGLSFADYVQYSPALEGQLRNINKFAFVTVFKTLLVFQNQLWCYGNMAENHWSVLWVGFFFSRNVNVLVSSAAAAIKAFAASSSHNSTVRSRDKDSKYRCDYRRLLWIRSKAGLFSSSHWKELEGHKLAIHRIITDFLEYLKEPSWVVTKRSIFLSVFLPPEHLQVGWRTERPTEF